MGDGMERGQTLGLEPCPFCNMYVGITNDKDFETHLIECPQNPANLSCPRNGKLTCENMGLFLSVDVITGGPCFKVMCSKMGCFKRFDTSLLPQWEVGVPEPGPLS